MSPAVNPALDSGRDRERYGCIVSFENGDGRTFSVHRVGPPIAALSAACDIALALDPTFRVVSYCTPQGIYTDLQGHRRNSSSPDAGFHRTGNQTPELMALGRAKRRDMAHPRLLP